MELNYWEIVSAMLVALGIYRITEGIVIITLENFKRRHQNGSDSNGAKER